MSRTYRIHVNRDNVRVDQVSTPATVAIGIEKQKPVVLAVGETRESLEQRWQELVATGQLHESPRVVEWGEDRWWDSVAQGEKVNPPSAETAATVLFVEPLRSTTWALLAINPLVRYAVYQSIGTAFLPRRVELTVSREFTDVEYGRIVDAVRAHAGRHVHLQDDRPPEKKSSLQVLARVLPPTGWTLCVAANVALGFYSDHRSTCVLVLALIGLGSLGLVILGNSICSKLRYEPTSRAA